MLKRLIKYKDQADRTWLDPEGDIYFNLLHITTGLSSEVEDELLEAIHTKNKINIKEEIGDIIYFSIQLANHFNFWYKTTDVGITILPSLTKNSKNFLLSTLGKLNDAIKSETIYRKDKNTLSKFLLFLDAVERIAKDNGFTMEECIEAVLAKLEKRYKEKFSYKEATDRDLDAELDAMIDV